MLVFFFNDTATTEIYTLSLHDALPISGDPHDDRRHHRGDQPRGDGREPRVRQVGEARHRRLGRRCRGIRSEEHTSELQSRQYLVCRLLLEKKKYIFLLILYHLPSTTPY